MKKSRFLYLHLKANAGKIAALEALQTTYTAYLQVCVTTMLSAHRFSVPLSERQLFFPGCEALSSQIVKNIRAHAVQIVSAWAASKYTNTLRKKLRKLSLAGWLDKALYAALCLIGKRSIETTTPKVTQEALDLYWLLLLDVEIAGRAPSISTRCGMRMSEMTAVFGKSEDTTLTAWWIGFSHLESGASRIQLPLVGNPYLSQASHASKGILARKDKRGRWRFEVVEKREWEVAAPSPEKKKVALDVGLNVVAATSDGRLLGRDLKPKFNALYGLIKELRANRQRQGLPENSQRLDCLEAKLSGLVASMVGQVANLLILLYAGYVFVLEDLDLGGCKGQKRYAYRALHHNLGRKAPTEVVNPAYTSQECPSCGFVSRKNRNGTKFVCRLCGRRSHADVVGGLNLLRRSEDKQIEPEDYPSEVKLILRERYLQRRRMKASSVRECKKAPAPSGPRLTVRESTDPRIASNQVASQFVLFD